MDSNWTVQSSGLQWTPVHFSHRQSRSNLAVKKVDWSPYGIWGGDCKDLLPMACLHYEQHLDSYPTLPVKYDPTSYQPYLILQLLEHELQGLQFLDYPHEDVEIQPD